MKKLLLTLLTLIFVSCEEQVHDLEVGEYHLEYYEKGEKLTWDFDDGEYDTYHGLISEDTLRLVSSAFSSRSTPGCAGDTLDYYRIEILVPLRVKHEKLVWSYFRMDTREYIYDEQYFPITAIDTCIRDSERIEYPFIVRENVIEYYSCKDLNEECKPHEVSTFHLVRP